MTQSHAPKPQLRSWQDYLREPSAVGMTIAEACQVYLDDLERRESRSLINKTTIIRRHIVPAMGAMTCEELRPMHIEAWLDWQLAEGYATKTARKHHAVLSGVLELAVTSGALESNPARMVARGRLPSTAPRDPDRAAHEVLEPSHVGRMIWDARLPQTRRWLWTLLLFTGARVGELIAFEWRDLSMREPLNELLIQRQFVRLEKRVRGTKTGHIRRIPVHPILQAALKEMKQWAESLGRPSHGEALLCMYERGGRLTRWHESTVLSAWRKDLATVGIPEPSTGPRRVHSSRHTFVSLLLRAGVSEHVIARMTHPGQSRGRGSAVLTYAHEDWPSLCRAVLRYPLNESHRERYANQLALGGLWW